MRLVFLTQRGVTTRAELLTGMFATPPELLGFSEAQLRRLRDLLDELPTGAAARTKA